jgi:DnaK suppressor protein
MADELSKAQLSELKGILRDQHAQLREEVSAALEHPGNQELQEIVGRVRDPGEESVADLIADLNLTRIDHLSDELRAVERALTEFDTGGYGICSRCGQPIGYARLKAQPTAALCIEDQRKQEQEFGSGRGSSL